MPWLDRRKSDMSKQSTLFKAWGDPSKPDCQQSAASKLPEPQTPSMSVTTSVDNEVYGDNYDDFFADDLTDEDLLQTCGDDVVSARQQPLISEHDRNFHQRTLAFHVGPSHSVLNTSIVEEDIPGFDAEAGEVWIYPTNYPVRDYQYNIVQRSLFTNTLVCLPTGLGKTFIAAVVMYNFYRWYPDGKVVFLAPTKPLVSQQIEACYNITGIPLLHTAEMTGTL